MLSKNEARNENSEIDRQLTWHFHSDLMIAEHEEKDHSGIRMIFSLEVSSHIKEMLLLASAKTESFEVSIASLLLSFHLLCTRSSISKQSKRRCNPDCFLKFWCSLSEQNYICLGRK